MCRALTLGVALMVSASTRAQTSTCGDIANAYGPYDYRTDRDKLQIVETFHFTPEVEALIRGRSGYLGGDLDYTLRAFPNHHRALIAVMNYGRKMKTTQPEGLPRQVECYFERAIRFRPDDEVARMLYAKFLAGVNRISEAARELEIVSAAAAAAGNGFTQYNVGLLYFELGQFDRALKQAHLAASLGFSGTALRDELSRAGRWQDAPGSNAASSVAPQATTPSPSAQPR